MSVTDIWVLVVSVKTRQFKTNKEDIKYRSVTLKSGGHRGKWEALGVGEVGRPPRHPRLDQVLKSSRQPCT